MSSIRALLSRDPLATADAELRRRAGRDRFGAYLPPAADELWPLVLSVFARSSPYRYWDPASVESALEVLETSTERTAEALLARSREIGVGVDNLFRRASVADEEEGLSAAKPRDLLRLATGFHPDYLRVAEHVFGNVLTLYWAILKKGGVDGRFDLRGAVSLVESRRHQLLLAGYDDRVRNAIAHGEMVFRGEGVIQYGQDVANYRLSAAGFLERYDVLYRTSNALVIALLLFLARHKEELVLVKNFTLPVGVLTLLVSAGAERPGLKLLGTVESEYPRTGKQLHVAIQTMARWRIQVLLDCARIALLLLENGAAGYARYVFDVDHGRDVSSLAMIKPSRLAELLEQDAPAERLGEIFDENMLLWYDESKLRSMVRGWKSLFLPHLRLAWDNVQRDWERSGFRRAARRYYIKKIENRSTAGVRRIHVTAVLRHPSLADDREAVKEILGVIVRKAAKVNVMTETSDLSRSWRPAGRPVYVWVALYRLDGTFRWLGSGGWQGGNLVAVVERIYNPKMPPVFVPKPEEVWKGMRLRYSMDTEAYAEAMVKLAGVISEIESGHEDRP